MFKTVNRIVSAFGLVTVTAAGTGGYATFKKHSDEYDTYAYTQTDSYGSFDASKHTKKEIEMRNRAVQAIQIAQEEEGF